MEHSLFYIAGGALIVVALAVSLVGIRSEKFPSGTTLRVGVLAVALLVAATGLGAVELAQSEQADRLEEANREADLEESVQNVEGQQEGDTESPTPADETSGPGDAVDQGKETSPSGGLDGGAVFVDTGCGGCHSLAALGDQAQGAIGPNLDEALVDKDKAFIEESIVDPGAEVEPGFPDGTMPTTYEDQLTPEQLAALVAFLAENAGSGG